MSKNIDLNVAQSKLLVKNKRLEFLSKKYDEELLDKEISVCHNGIVFGNGKLEVRENVSNSIDKEIGLYILTLNKQTAQLIIGE